MQHAKDLLDKYNSGRASEEEKALVESWYLQYSPGSSDLTEEELLKAHVDGLRSLRARIGKAQRPVFVWLRVAASVAGFLLLIWGWYRYQYRPDTKIAVTRQEQPAAIIPGGNKAILTLGNGERINLTDVRDGELTRQAGIKIVKQSDGQLVYMLGASSPANPDNAAVVFNTLEVPRGGQYQVRLPDGTKVWLNSSSTLHYPPVFGKDERRVELSGEAYFEVAKKVDGLRVPFIVVTENQEVEVLGTHFNVHAYPDEDKASTTLLEGSVKVKVRNTSYTGLLRPGQQAQVHSLKPVQIRQITNDDVIAWKNGYFAFEDADLHVIMDNLARWYDVDIVYKGMVTPQKFGGAFPRTATLSDLLKYLEAYGGIHFKIVGRKIIVSP